jgi:hypothetical protein
LCLHISARYKEESTEFYHPEDLKRGSISGVDRKGRSYQFPLVSLSIGVVNNQVRRPHSIREVSYLAAEAKYHAKQSTDNVYHITPRRDAVSNEPPYPSRFSSSSLLPPSLAQFTCDQSRYDSGPLYDTEEHTLAEYEQKVH